MLFLNACSAEIIDTFFVYGNKRENRECIKDQIFGVISTVGKMNPLQNFQRKAIE